MNYENNKSIAILLAAYNAENFLAEQIESLISQTNSDWTLYIRNDGSKDGTDKIIEHYCSSYSNIIEIEKGGKNLGCRNNFFSLLEAVDSTYYMFCDADDVWLENKIEISLTRMKELERNNANKPLLVHTDSAVYDGDLNLIAKSYWRSVNINPDKFLSFNLICVCCPVGGSTMLINKNVKQLMFPLVENNLIFDYWIAINVVKYGIISTLHIPTKKYRQHGANVCGVTMGRKNTFLFKLKNSFSLIKKYKKESQVLDTIGYGGFMKYLFFKMIVVAKIRLLKY